METLIQHVERLLGKNTDDVNLEGATLFADSNRGIYIPQYFAQNVKREFVTGVSAEDYKVLEAGPDGENYWEAWADVLDNAKINDPKQDECYLHHDGDLWVVPIPKPANVKIVLGHKFRPFYQLDWQGYAGADEGSYICYIEPDVTLILSPNGSIQEHVHDGNGLSACYNWTYTEVNIEPGYNGRRYPKTETGT